MLLRCDRRLYDTIGGKLAGLEIHALPEEVAWRVLGLCKQSLPNSQKSIKVER